MDFDLNLTALLSAIAVTLALGLCLPDALYLLRVTGIKRGVLAGPDGAASGARAIASPEVADQLAQLGFTPAGLYWEQMPAHKCFQEAIYVSRTGDCFAAVYRLFNNDLPRVAFKTAFADGAYVLTQSYQGGMEKQEATLWAGGVEDMPLTDVVAEHRRRVELFTLAGHEPIPALTIEDHVEAEWAYMEHPSVQGEHFSTVKGLLLMKAGFLFVVPLIASQFGIGQWGLSALLLAQGLSILCFRYYGAMVERMLPREESG
jgi:hypothetical protein